MASNKSANEEGRKFALIHMGTDEVYGLEFVAAELKKHGHRIRWFDGDSSHAVGEVVDWGAKYMCFSPLTTFFPSALEFSRKVKSLCPDIRSIFGGHHVTAVPEACDLDGIDKIVVGPVYGTIDQIVAGSGDKILKGSPVPVHLMTPSRREYFEAVPNIGERHKRSLVGRNTASTG
jgi:radical SAM superfamily enzyme YgiQ (UPF0313 family)